MKSKCTDEIMNIQGMSGKMTRHFYNNICSLQNINYLEIGCHKGSSTISALYKNDTVNSIVIDNWSEFGGPKTEFLKNVNDFLPNQNLIFLDEDSFQMKTELKVDSVDVYLYDGHHSVESHTKAITHFYKYLKNNSIILVDDYNWQMAKEGTEKGLLEVNAKIIYEKHISTPEGQDGFWNGCGVFLIEK
jgi:hypothetical protein